MATESSTTERVGFLSNLLSALSSSARGLFVWGTWALLFLSALAYVWKYSHDIPCDDDWNLVVPIVTGQQPLTKSWLWQQYCQQRFPFPKLMLHAGKKLGLKDLRAPLYLNVCALGILAFFMIVVAKRLRGRIIYPDVFLPLTLLHWGRPEIFLHAEFFYYVVPMVLAGILLLIIVGWGTQLTFGTAVLAGICLVLLPLSGAVGLVCVPLPILWLGYVGMYKWCSAQGHDVRCGTVILAFVLIGLLIVGLYFRNFAPNTVSYYESAASVGIGLQRALKVLAIGFGMGGGETLWTFSGPLVAALLVMSSALFIVPLWNQPGERSRALGLLLFVCFVICYALLLGWERPFCLGYYGTYPALGLCCVYYVWGLYASSGISSFVQAALFAFVCAIFPFNMQIGLEHAWHKHYEQMEPLEQDLRAGAPPYKIVRYHRAILFSDMGSTEPFIPLLRSLREAGRGNFRHMKEDPPFREVPLALTPSAVTGMTWDKGTARVSGDDSYVVFPVPEAKLVAGIRITFRHSAEARPFFKMFWKRSDQTKFPPAQSYSNEWIYVGPDEPFTETIWVDETIDQIRIHPDNKPCDFKILKIVLIVPTDQ